MFALSEAPDSYRYRTASVGQTVKFPCPTKLLEDVDWVRLATPQSREEYIYLGNLGPRGLGLDPRFTVLDKSHSHSLVIKNVTVGDSAYYRCVEDSGLGNRHFYRLTVQGISYIFEVAILIEDLFHFECHYSNKKLSYCWETVRRESIFNYPIFN